MPTELRDQEKYKQHLTPPFPEAYHVSAEKHRDKQFLYIPICLA